MPDGRQRPVRGFGRTEHTDDPRAIGGSRPRDPRAQSQYSVRSLPLTVAAVAARLGVAASTLRTWDRRYGLGPSAHEAGSHRRYTPADVARLERMRELTLQGVAPADAARIAVHGDADGTQGEDRADGAIGSSMLDASQSAGSVGTVRSDRSVPERLLVDPLSLAAAAVEPDPHRARRMVAQDVADHGVLAAWKSLVEPAQEMIDQRGRVDKPGNDPESVLVDAVLAAVRSVAGGRGHTGDPEGRTVLILQENGSRLPAHVLAGALAERGRRARILRTGGALVAETRRAVGAHRVGALAILGAPDGMAEVVRSVVEEDEIEVYLVGGSRTNLWMPHVHHVRTLGAAAEELTEVVRGMD